MSPKVSVIVPIHNPGMYLKQCLDTILDQTLQEIEIICLNDGSTDGSAYLLEQYAQKDNRIKVITQECQGAGDARNKGMELATGEYLSFLDADDFFENNMLEYMYYTAKRDQTDIVICGHYIYDNLQKQDVDVKYPLQEAIEKSPLTQETMAPFLFDISYPGVCNKLFKRDFIKENKIRFSPVPRGEDLFFCWQALTKASKISVHGIPFFHYRINTPFQSTSINGKPTTIVLFLKMITELYQKISQLPFIRIQEKSFLRQVQKCLQHELDGKTGAEKRKSLTLILKELPKDLVQKLFFNHDIPSVSLVLCVYNGEKYLRECLESLIHQTLKNIEIICIDDASTDSSLKILNDYATQDNRIKVIKHSENKKLSIARRTAMREATGEFVLYVDADDYLELDACECLYFNSKIYDLEMCSFMSMEFLDNTRENFEEPYHRLLWLEERFPAILKKDALKEVIHRIAVTSGLTLYKNSFLKENHIEWLNKQIFFEDTLFFTESLLRTEKFGVLKETFLHKRTHDQCITQNRDKHFVDWCEIVLRVLTIVQSYGDEEILKNYLDSFSHKGWETYKNFSYELLQKYEQEIFDFATVLLQKYRYSLPPEMQIWYDDIKELSPEDIVPFCEAKKNIDVDFSKTSIFDAFTIFYNQLRNKNLYCKYPLNYDNYLKFKFRNKLFSCMVEEKEKLLMDISKKLPTEVVEKLLIPKDIPAVSIILPVYNMEKYLPQCLDSLIHQTLNNIEIICVDDGSTDGSLKILQNYAQKDNRIKVLTQKNQKQSIARRNAMNIASGEYIQYVDADDYIDLNTCECLYLYSKIHDLDMLLFQANDFQDETNEPVSVPYHHLEWLPENFVSVFSLKNIQNVIHQIAVTACLTFYKHNFLKENCIEWLNDSLWYEDTLFFTESILKAKRIGTFKKQFYHRRLHKDNTILKMNSNFADFCKIVQKTLSLSKEITDKKTFKNLFEGYILKVYNNYLTLSEIAKTKFLKEFLTFLDNMKENYNLLFPALVEKFYNGILENYFLNKMNNTPSSENGGILACKTGDAQGLCNRLKNLFSFLRYYHPSEMVLIWPNSGYVQDSFKELFIFDYPVKIHEYSCPEKTDVLYTETKFNEQNWQFWINKENDDIPNGFSNAPFSDDGRSIDFEYEQIPQNLKNAYLPYFQALKPTPEIKKIIDSVSLPNGTVAIHVRNASDWTKEGRSEKLEKFIECMKKFPEDICFFLASSTKETSDKLKSVFGNRILEIPNKDYHSMQHAVADLYLLAQCKQAIYSCGSTFSEFSWWLGGCKARVQVIGSYEKWRISIKALAS